MQRAGVVEGGFLSQLGFGQRVDGELAHPRGELLFGLAEGWRRLGDEAKARAYLEQIVRTCKDSPDETEARGWLAKKPDASHPSYPHCIGCHAG